MIIAQRYSSIAKVLSIIAIILTLSPVLYAFVFAGLGNLGILISVLLPVLFISIGYGLQTLVCKIVGYKQPKEEITVNGKLQFVDPSVSAVPIFICILIGVGAFFLLRAALDHAEIKYDPYSLFLILIPAGVCAFAIAGCIFWFYPYYKILPMSSLSVHVAVFMVTYALPALYTEISPLLLTVCFVLFFSIFMAVRNLKNIEDSINHAKMRMPENNFRSYNFSLTVKFLATILLLSVFVFCAVYAVYSNIHTEPKLLDPEKTKWENRDIGSFFNSEYEHNSDKTLDIKAELEEDNGGTSFGQLISYIVVFGGLIAFICYKIKKNDLIKKVFTIISMIWQGLFDLIAEIFDMIGRVGVKYDYELPGSYVDTESTINCIDYYAEYGEYKALELLSITEFDRQLNEKESFEEKYAYAYTVYCALIRQNPYGINISDTPRLINAKLVAQRKYDIEKATPVYEEIRYRMAKPKELPGEEDLYSLTKSVHEMLKIL